MSGPPRVSLFGRVDAWWRAEAPAERLALVRVVVGVYATLALVGASPSLLRLASLEAPRFEPVGPVSLLASPLPPGVVWGVLALALASGVAFSLGWRYRASAPVFASTLLWSLSYRHSWGHMGHAEHLVTMHVCVLAAAPASDGVALDARAGRTRAGDPREYGWPLRLLMLVVVLSYMLAGWAKLAAGGWGWIDGAAVRNQIAAEALRKTRIGALSSPLIEGMLTQGWLFAVLSCATLGVELGAFVALLDSRLRALWVASVWAMHVGIAAAMAILFGYPLSGAAFACFFPLERALAWWRARS